MRFILLFTTLLLAYGYHLLTGWYPEVAWIQGDFMSLVWPAFWAFISVVIVVFVSLNKDSDPVLGAWGALSLAGCMLLTPLIIARENQAGIQLSTSQFMDDARQAIRLRQLKENEEIKAQIASRKERSKTDRFVQYEGRIPDDLLDKLRQLDADMLQDVKSHADRYQQALDANVTLGPDAWVRFRRIDQLSVEIAKHKDLYEQTRAFSQFVESFEASYMKRIEDLDLQPPADRVAIAELERILQEWERTRLYELRRLDVQLLGSALKALNILSDEWGKWSYNTRDNVVEFEDPSKEADFNEAILYIKAILEEVRQINEGSQPED